MCIVQGGQAAGLGAKLGNTAPSCHDTDLTPMCVGQGGQAAGLGAKLGNTRGRYEEGEVGAPAYPELLRVLLEKLLSEEYQGCLVEELPFSQYSSPVLQALLLAVKGDM